MDDRLILLVTLIPMLLFLPTISIAQESPPTQYNDTAHCGGLRKFKSTNETEAIKLTWNVPIENEECKDVITGYNITYGTIGTTLESTFVKWDKNQAREIAVVLENLIPERQYMIVIIVSLTENRITLRRPWFITAGRASVPQIHLHPMEKTVRINNDSTTIDLTCMANGASSYFWIKRNGSISSTAEGVNTNKLLLQNIVPSDSGFYQCVAVNENGTSYSNYGRLTVEVVSPEVSIKPAEAQVTEGKTVEFSCTSTGFGNFTYQWFLNDLPVDGQATPTLVINDVSEYDTGNYMCFVRNAYGGIGQSETARLILLDQSCPSVTVNYTGFSITWNETLAGVTLEAPCTGDNLNGIVRRRCIMDDLWEEFIECFREETSMLFDQAVNLSMSVNILDVTERINQASDIVTALVNITAPIQGPIYAEDINLSVDIVSILNNVTETAVANLTANDTFFEDTTSVISNLLSENNRNSWEQLERTSPSTGQSLVKSTEQVTKLLSETLTNDNTEAMQARTNIVIKAELVPYGNADAMYIFPDEDDDLTNYTGGNAHVVVSNGLLQAIANDSKEFITIASTIIRNDSVLRLPSGTSMSQFPASPIFSLQIDPLPADSSILANNPILMMFDVGALATLSEPSNGQNVQDYTLDDLSCNFYDYSWSTATNLNQIGGWSTEGLTIDRSHSNKTSVTCTTTHLTSFAVLVSIQDEQPPSTADRALSIVSYIGCGISLVCLCLSIILLSYTIYKTKDKKVNHLFIHLNLCIALALGLVVFISGIENAASSEVACTFVAALLQYFFISAFCWMLCEGVILYMMLVTVLGNKLNKRRFFFVLGWGPAIPIVGISVGLAHEYYGTGYYCWIESDGGAIAAFIAPIVAIILVNCVFLAITLKVLVTRKMKEETTSNRDVVKGLLKAVIILLPLLGITWIIGILAISENTQLFAWFFAILNSLQGAFIFLFHVLRNEQVQEQVRMGYSIMRNNEALKRQYSVKSSHSFRSSSIRNKSLSRASSNASAHSKVTSTTSFGDNTIKRDTQAQS